MHIPHRNESRGKILNESIDYKLRENFNMIDFSVCRLLIYRWLSMIFLSAIPEIHSA